MCEHKQFHKTEDGGNEVCDDCGQLLCWMCQRGISDYKQAIKDGWVLSHEVCSSYCHIEMRLHYM